MKHIVPSTWDYKDPDQPGAGYGRQFGVMAQDLEKSEIGKTAVKETPDGKKMVDYAKLGQINIGGLGLLHDKTNKMQDEIDDLKAAMSMKFQNKKGK